jgi:cysteinyl-tRNA synthetase
LLDEAAGAEAAFKEAVAARDGAGAASAALALEASIRAWANDPSQTDDVDRARATLRSIVVRLGETAGTGLADPAAAVAPFVETMLELRASARAGGRYDDADLIRDRLVAAGIEVNDGPDGTTWRLI